MKISLIKIGRLAYPEYRTMAHLYFSRLSPKHLFELIELKDDSQAFKFLASKSSNGSTIWIFDEKGNEYDSIAFSNVMRQLRDNGTTKNLYLIIGHPLGISSEIRELSSKSLRLSPLTFTSDLAFLVICEQLYRAFEIIKGSGYHHA
jgi:23S rRNA (pseudouridine1915-N3)-methyltransferase